MQLKKKEFKVKGVVELVVIIMRSHIFHNGHLHLVKEGCKIANNVLILVGSVNRCRSEINPFSYDERVEMIRGALSGTETYKCQIKPLNDHLHIEYEWESEVQRIAHDHMMKLGLPLGSSIAIAGHIKDNSSYYIDSFIQWQQHHVDNLDNISATPLRNAYFGGNENWHYEVCNSVPDSTLLFLENFRETDDYTWLVDHIQAVNDFKKDYLHLPHGVNFVTGDALVTCGGHVLLVKRGSHPGKNQWALPGGFKEPGEYARNCILRELEEETDINVPPRALQQAYRGKTIFEDPKRDDRGDFTTHVGSFILTDSKLPKVKACNKPGMSKEQLETLEARWFPFAQVRRMSKVLFADHYFIIQSMLASGYGTGFTSK